MALDWTKYPTSGRTQYFAGSFCQRPSGVGYAYALQTFGATGIYTQFNSPIVCTTTELTNPSALRWESDGFPFGFISPLTLFKDFNAITKEQDWVLAAIRADPIGNMASVVSQLQPNLRNRFTMPRVVNYVGDPLEEVPNVWTITPMTREQVNE